MYWQHLILIWNLHIFYLNGKEQLTTLWEDKLIIFRDNVKSQIQGILRLKKKKKKRYGYVIKTYQKKKKKRNYVIKYIVKYLHNIFFLNKQILSSRCGFMLRSGLNGLYRGVSICKDQVWPYSLKRGWT